MKNDSTLTELNNLRIWEMLLINISGVFVLCMSHVFTLQAGCWRRHSWPEGGASEEMERKKETISPWSKNSPRWLLKHEKQYSMCTNKTQHCTYVQPWFSYSLSLGMMKDLLCDLCLSRLSEASSFALFKTELVRPVVFPETSPSDPDRV